MPAFLYLSTFKQHAAIDHNDADVLISGYLDAAEAYLGDPENGWLRRPVVAQSFTESFASFEGVALTHPDLAEITSLTVDGEEVSFGYDLIGGALSLHSGEEWPDVDEEVRVTYEAGWSADSVPQPIVNAGYYIAATLYEHRNSGEGSAENLNSYLAIALAGYRRPAL